MAEWWRWTWRWTRVRQIGGKMAVQPWIYPSTSLSRRFFTGKGENAHPSRSAGEESAEPVAVNHCVCWEDGYQGCN